MHKDLIDDTQVQLACCSAPKSFHTAIFQIILSHFDLLQQKKKRVSNIISGVSENEPPQRTTRCGFIHNHTKRKSQILVTNDMNAVSLKLLDNCSPFLKNISLSLTHNVSFIKRKNVELIVSLPLYFKTLAIKLPVLTCQLAR